MKRTTMAALVAITILVGVGAGYAAAHVLGDDSTDPEATSTPSKVTKTTPTPSKDADDTPIAPDGSGSDGGAQDLIDYVTKANPDGVFIDDPDDTSALKGAPSDFTDFVADTVRGLDGSACPDAAVGLGIQRLMPADGFSLGGVSECGGYVAIWKRLDGSWDEIIGGQAAFSCDELKKNSVPAKLLPDPRCFDESSSELVNYTG